MDDAAEQSWQQGMVTHSSMSLNFDQESWDDSVILDIFDEAIRSHRTKVFRIFTALCTIPSVHSIIALMNPEWIEEKGEG